MQRAAEYHSPLGKILLSADEEGLTGLWFQGAKAPPSPAGSTGTSLPALDEARRWLDLYFAGREPPFMPPLHPVGSPFCREVWQLLLEIPYGHTISYGDLARILARRREGGRMSPQAVGGAVGRNPISLLIPCHRVMGSQGSLTGYAGGLWRKRSLLLLEGVEAVAPAASQDLHRLSH